MSEHYYSNEPTSLSDQNTINFMFKNRTFSFTTDAGVFSKKNIDFGSALLIEKMMISENSRVLDVGCGYGPIGIIAATLCPVGHVTMIDINQRAIELSRINILKNQIQNATVLLSDLWQEIEGEKFDVILTNPPIRAGKLIVNQIFIKAYESLVDGGHLWVVIQKKQGAASAYLNLQTIFNSVEEISKSKGYRIYKAIK